MMEIPVIEFEMLGQRAQLHKVVMIQVERRVEDLEEQYKELAREVDDIDVEPSYTCDCACDSTISDLEDDLQNAYKRIEALEKFVNERIAPYKYE